MSGGTVHPGTRAPARASVSLILSCSVCLYFPNFASLPIPNTGYFNSVWGPLSVSGDLGRRFVLGGANNCILCDGPLCCVSSVSVLRHVTCAGAGDHARGCHATTDRSHRRRHRGRHRVYAGRRQTRAVCRQVRSSRRCRWRWLNEARSMFCPSVCLWAL